MNIFDLAIWYNILLCSAFSQLSACCQWLFCWIHKIFYTLLEIHNTRKYMIMCLLGGCMALCFPKNIHSWLINIISGCQSFCNCKIIWVQHVNWLNFYCFTDGQIFGRSHSLKKRWNQCSIHISFIYGNSCKGLSLKNTCNSSCIHPWVYCCRYNSIDLSPQS